MNAFLKCFTILSLFVSVIHISSPVNAFSRQNLKTAVLDSLHKSPPGVQDVTIGPLKDGLTIRMQLEYLLTGKGSQVVRKTGFPSCISVDRLDAAKANLVLDAVLICQTYGFCDKVRDYIELVWKAKESKDLLLFEEMVTQLRPKLRRWQLSPNYARQWISEFNETMLGLQLHELAHILLHRKREGSFETEAEADGFALAVASIVELPVGGVNYLLSLRVDPERNFEAVAQEYPPATCRVEAFELGLSAWKRKYDRDRREASWPFNSGQSSRSKFLYDYMPKLDGMCDRYAVSFSKGVQKANAIIDANTALETVNRKGDRCAAFGGKKF